MIIVGIIALLLLAFCFGVGGYLFFAACGRGKEINWTDEEAVKATPFGKFYTYISQGHRWLREHNAQDITMTGSDGLQLHAVWVPAENPKGTVLFVHGYRSSGCTDFSVAYDRYYNDRMNILIPSHRAHGASQGKFITFGVKESRDIYEWILLHNARFGEVPVLCSGLSMGAATVMYLAGMDLPENVRGFVADCGFTSPKEIISHVFRQQTHLPAWPFLWATEVFARILGGFSLSEKDTRKTLTSNTRPILLVHGLDDDYVPPEMTRSSFEASSGDKTLLLVEGASHGISFLVNKEAYLEKIHQLLEKVQDREK